MKSLKNSMYNFLLAGLIMLGGVNLTAAQDTPNFDRLKQMFESGEILVADFTHTYEDSFTGESQVTEGRITIGKDHYKISGQGQAMVVDGATSRVYDGSKNRVIISDYYEEEDDFAPSRMLQGVDESYSVSEHRSDSETIIRLTSDDPFAVFTGVIIRLDDNLIPILIEATDQADNLLTTRFYDGYFTEYSEKVFQLSVPDDAEEIDLRYDSR